MSILWLDTMAMPIEIAKHVDKKAIAGGGESYVFFRRPIWLGSSSLPFLLSIWLTAQFTLTEVSC